MYVKHKHRIPSDIHGEAVKAKPIASKDITEWCNRVGTRNYINREHVILEYLKNYLTQEEYIHIKFAF